MEGCCYFVVHFLQPQSYFGDMARCNLAREMRPDRGTLNSTTFLGSISLAVIFNWLFWKQKCVATFWTGDLRSLYMQGKNIYTVNALILARIQLAAGLLDWLGKIKKKKKKKFRFLCLESTWARVENRSLSGHIVNIPSSKGSRVLCGIFWAFTEGRQQWGEPWFLCVKFQCLQMVYHGGRQNLWLPTKQVVLSMSNRSWFQYILFFIL